MIYLLAKPQQIKDTDWIRPGKATWEWWHCAILEKAPFPSGHQNLSTQMYKYYIDFASENKIPYLLVDAGWSNVFNHADLNNLHSPASHRLQYWNNGLPHVPDRL